MEKKELIRIALYADRKNMDFETLRYSDEMYGKEDKTEDVWEYITELKEIGSLAFNEKYAEYV